MFDFFEVWKPVVDYPEYEVSNIGRVRKGKKIKKISNNEKKYGITYTHANIRAKNKEVHQLVLSTFRPNTAPWLYDRVDHIDGDGTNNNLYNLRWSNATLNMLNRKNAKGYDKTKFGTYHARIQIEGKQKNLGTYKTAEEAHARYLEARNKFYDIIDIFGIFQPK